MAEEPLPSLRRYRMHGPGLARFQRSRQIRVHRRILRLHSSLLHLREYRTCLLLYLPRAVTGKESSSTELEPDLSSLSFSLFSLPSFLAAASAPSSIRISPHSDCEGTRLRPHRFRFRRGHLHDLPDPGAHGQVGLSEEGGGSSFRLMGSVEQLR